MLDQLKNNGWAYRLFAIAYGLAGALLVLLQSLADRDTQRPRVIVTVTDNTITPVVVPFIKD
jgi:hypothetical protein